MSKLDVRITMVNGMPVTRVIEATPKRKEETQAKKKKGGKKK